MANSRTRPDQSLQKELEETLQRRIHVLAQASGPNETVLATRDLVAVRQQGHWRTWGWEEILNGRWRVESSTFEWTSSDGRRTLVVLDEPGQLPELFRERVQASVVVTETHDLTRGSVQIIGRRRLDGSDALTWYATASGGASLDDEATAGFVVARTDRLKAEWGRP